MKKTILILTTLLIVLCFVSCAMKEEEHWIDASCYYGVTAEQDTMFLVCYEDKYDVYTINFSDNQNEYSMSESRQEAVNGVITINDEDKFTIATKTLESDGQFSILEECNCKIVLAKVITVEENITMVIKIKLSDGKVYSLDTENLIASGATIELL